MVGFEESLTDADIDELNWALGEDDGGPPEPGPNPAPEPEGDDEEDDEEERRWRAPRTPRIQRPLLVALLVVLAAGIVVGAFLFSQTLTGPSTVGSILTRNCEPATPTPANSIPVNTPGFVQWSCGALTNPALTVNGAGSVTPTFTLGSGFTTLYIYKISAAPPTAGCSSAGNNNALTSGASVSFTTGDAGGWNYCSDYTSAPPGAFGNTVVSWSQP